MPPARVIEPLDVLANGFAGLVARCEGRAPDEFRLYGLEHGLDHGIVVAVAAPARRVEDARLRHDDAMNLLSLRMRR